ncbi:hypothetical protein E9934_10745 [Nocardioides caeni]|uniref:Polymer-forming cytoskeletal protein n=1 Tax=Nocardioides caeni TaxID=574700 RepID=A0A4S8NDN1_9ACTN|nr:hypothetical protein E9934_10745 [Nocardioides caeni]
MAVPLLGAGLTLVTSSPAYADDRVCRGAIGARTIDDNVVVPRGATCRLIGTRVEGNVLVKSGGTLRAEGVRVDGNIQAQGARRVVVIPRADRRSVVKGNIQLTSGGRLGGVVQRSVVDGDIQLFSNRGRFVVRGNVVDGNLQCKSNTPRPTGGNNRVEGNKEGQCRGL